MFGGINKLKYYLARVLYKDVVVCDHFPIEAIPQMKDSLGSIKEHNAK